MKAALSALAADRIAAAFAAIAALCAAFAFVGLSSSGYWIDELFTLFIIDHGGGQAEVLRRALTDTHPPVYYFLAHAWISLLGSSEAGLRSLSAVLMVASLPLLFAILRPIYSLRATAFAVALAASSKLFFEQSQNSRNYPLTVLLATALAGLTLSIRRRAAAGRALPAWLALSFWAIGMIGSFTHFYLFLVVGAAHFYLLIHLTTLKQRAAVVLSGASIFAPVAAYAVILTRGSQQDMEHMWFSNAFVPLSRQMLNGLSQAWSWAAIAAVLLLAVAAIRRRPGAAPFSNDPADERGAAVRLALLTIVCVIAAGLTVSFVIAPSFGARNLAVLGPFFWIAAAGLYDGAAPDPRRAAGKVLIGLVFVFLLANVANLRGRFLLRAEAYRESAALVAATPACAGQTIVGVLPDLFGPPTPFFRTLARDSFFGRYYPRRDIAIVTPDEFAPAATPPEIRGLWQSRLSGGGCPILAWAVHDVDAKRAAKLAVQMAASAGVAPEAIRVRSVSNEKMWLVGISKAKPSAFIFERAAP